jgi:hypothetical protein
MDEVYGKVGKALIWLEMIVSSHERIQQSADMVKHLATSVNALKLGRLVLVYAPCSHRMSPFEDMGFQMYVSKYEAAFAPSQRDDGSEECEWLMKCSWRKWVASRLYVVKTFFGLVSAEWSVG